MSIQKFYALLPWEQYHKLEQNGGAYILTSGKDADEKIREENQQTEVLAFWSIGFAKAAVDAFNSLCAAAWTPNQSIEERKENHKICADCDYRLDELRKISIKPAF